MRAIVVEDRALVRDGLCLLLRDMGIFERIHATPSLTEATQLLRDTEPASDGLLVLLDLDLPDATGLQSLDGVLSINPHYRVLVCSGHEAPDVIRRCFDLGALGYVTKNASASVLETAVQTVLRGERHVPAELLSPDVPLDRAPRTALSPRQCEVLRGVASGLSNKQIASELGLSPATVRAHLHTIFRHLDVENRTQAAMHPVAMQLRGRSTASD